MRLRGDAGGEYISEKYTGGRAGAPAAGRGSTRTSLDGAPLSSGPSSGAESRDRVERRAANTDAGIEREDVKRTSLLSAPSRVGPRRRRIA